MANKTVAHQFGKILKEQRKRYKLTQEKLAELADLSVEHIQRLEGKSPSGVRLETIVKISHGLKIRPSTLINKL